MSATRILDQVERYVQMLLEERERNNKRKKSKAITTWQRWGKGKQGLCVVWEEREIKSSYTR